MARHQKTRLAKTVVKKRVVKENGSQVEVLSDEEKTILLFIDLVEVVRHSKIKTESDKAFNTIVDLMGPKIEQMSYKFKIPGLGRMDVYQEALYALRYKAIKDYDCNKSTLQAISPFDKFAILCIRRHLSTKFKSSYQNKSRTLNSSISLDQDRKEYFQNDEPLFLSDILAQSDDDAALKYYNKEYNKVLFSKLFHRLSELEKEVFMYYAQRLTYEEIVAKINYRKTKNKINIKSIDNSISRIKQKAKIIYEKYG
jgi:DNA-directed RNA polymerase specialized sigma24 family protein